MTFISLGEAVDRALSAGYFGAAGTVLETEKARAEVGAKARVSSLEEFTPSANGIYADRCMDRAEPTRMPRAARSIHLYVVEGGRRDGGGVRSPAYQRSPEGKARRTVLRLVHPASSLG